MAEPIVGMPLALTERIDQIFPTLTESQIARVAAHGRSRRVQPGEVLLNVGDQVRFFVVTSGKIDIISPGSSQVKSIFSPAVASSLASARAKLVK